MKHTMRVWWPQSAVLLFFLALLCLQCGLLRPGTTGADADPNPAAAGFNAASSDAKAIELADAVMKAMGGRRAWDATHYLSWNFFGRRTLLWDKWTGNVWIQWTGRPQEVVVNLNTGKGKVWLGGKAQTNADTLAKYLDAGRKVWINDAYWLAMPFKLKDSGVTLKYLGEGKTEAGEDAHTVQLTFSSVGVTPDNKYHIWIDKKTNLVTQWAFFKEFNNQKPDFKNPWKDYKTYGKVMLSGDRGRDGVNLYPIEVLDVIPAALLEKFKE